MNEVSKLDDVRSTVSRLWTAVLSFGLKCPRVHVPGCSALKTQRVPAAAAPSQAFTILTC